MRRASPFLILLAVARPFAGLAAGDDAGAELFEARIRPVLVEHCYGCHSASAAKLKAGLRVDSREGLVHGGETGPALIPRDPERSLLLRALAYDDPDLQMPPKMRLPVTVVADFRRWIQAGAPWPGETTVPPSNGEGTPGAPATADSRGHLAAKGFDLNQRRTSHWAWQPIRHPVPPPVANVSWPRSEVDRFILARLEAAGLNPAPSAEPAALLRRLSFALTGLPPSAAEATDFSSDPGPAALEAVVDRLLGSPRFGEHWARHWLDKVRYAETMGHEFDYPILAAWRFRDYVVRAFNGNVPFDRFAREQIAGDLLPVRRDPASGLNESIIATSQFWFCQQAHSPVDTRVAQVDVVDNQIDVLAKAFLGLTVSCARCHDHKFDAISTRDYYALYGILDSSRYAIREMDDPAPRLRQARALMAIRDRVRRDLAGRLLSSAIPRAATNCGAAQQASLRPEDISLPRDGWFPDGEAFTVDPCSSGQVVPATGGGFRLVLPGWRDSGSLARRFQGALRSPTFTIDRGYVHLKVAGKGTRISLVIDGFTLIRAPIYGGLRLAVEGERPHWMTIDVSMWKGHRAWLEFTDYSAPDPATTLPASAMAADGWIAVGEVIASSLKDPPPQVTLQDPADPRGIILRWRDDPSQLDPREAAWLDSVLFAMTEGAAMIDVQRWTDLDAAVGEPELIGAMVEGTGLDQPVFIRGNPQSPGPTLPRRFLEALPEAARAAPFESGTGRLGLARAMTDDANPLFARVAVNWIWAHLFGAGLVSSVDNFGAMGAAPSHPELLDWLATEFRDGGYSVKRLVRLLVLSRAWQMSSRRADARAEEVDPENRLLHRANLERLEGETLRDAMLAVSGKLDPSLGGPPVPIHLTSFMEGRGRPSKSGPLDGAGRRSLYVEVRRNFLSPWMLAFDVPVPVTTVGLRSQSNVPAQALELMNDPFVAQQAALWSARILREVTGPDCAARRLERLYLDAFARPPRSEERRACEAYLEARRLGSTGEDAATWTDLCQVLFNAKEFAFVE